MARGADTLVAMTFNVRYDDEWDTAHRWRDRRELVIATIRAHDPDLIAVQEPTPDQWTDVAAGLDQMTAVEGGFVRPSRFDIVERGTVELPPGPPRTCAWVRLRDRGAGRPLIFASAHLDTAEHAWLPSARKIADELGAIGRDTAIVLAGDFNCAAGSEAHRELGKAGFRDTWYEAGHEDDDTITYNGFACLSRLPSGRELQGFLDATSPAGGEFAHYRAHVRRHRNYRIDWVLIRGGLSCTAALIDTRRDGDVLSSDHYPVVASLAWQ